MRLKCTLTIALTASTNRDHDPKVLAQSYENCSNAYLWRRCGMRRGVYQSGRCVTAALRFSDKRGPETLLDRHKDRHRWFHRPALLRIAAQSGSAPLATSG